MDEYHTTTLNLQKKRDRLSRLQYFLNGISPCSGENTTELRDFLTSVQFAFEYSEAEENDFVTSIVAMTREPLRTIVDLHLKAQKSSNKPLLWSELKSEITKACLSANENDFLRDRVETLKQGDREDIRTFCFRFKQAVSQAYSLAEQQGLILERLIKVLIRGFSNPTIREKVVLEKPDTIDKACTTAIEHARALTIAHTAPQQLSYQTNAGGQLHEPMEVDDIKKRFTDQVERKRSRSRESRRSMDKLVKDMENLNVNAKAQPRESRRDVFLRQRDINPPKVQFSTNKKEIASDAVDARTAQVEAINQMTCHYCKKPGHFIATCRVRLRDENKCFGCKRVGHELKNCWSSNQRQLPQQNPQQRHQDYTPRKYNRVPTSSNPITQAQSSGNGQLKARFDRENLSSRRDGSVEKQRLLNDIGDFHNKALGELNKSQ